MAMWHVLQMYAWDSLLGRAVKNYYVKCKANVRVCRELPEIHTAYSMDEKVRCMNLEKRRWRYGATKNVMAVEFIVCEFEI